MPASPPVSPPSRRFRWLWWLLAIGGLPYFALCLVAFFAQRKLIYFPTRVAAVAAENFSIRGARIESVAVKTADDLRLQGWLAQAGAAGEEVATGPARRNSPERPLLLFFHGNGGDRSWRDDTLELLVETGADVLIVDYRGYAENPGTPSEAGLALDARATWQFAVDELQVPPGRIILVGESLGSAVAMRLANEMCGQGTPPAGVLAWGAFSSLEDAAAWHFWWLPTRWLLLDRYRSATYAREVTCPILLLHGRRDTVVPFEIGRALFDACPAASASGVSRRFVELPRADHNDILATEGPAFRAAVLDFLRNACGDTPPSH